MNTAPIHGLADVLRELAEALDEQQVAFAVVGGLGVSVRTEPRFTRDVDLAVAADDDRAAEALVAALAPNYEPVTILEHDTLGRMAAVRLERHGQTPGGVVADLLFASSGVEAEVVEAAEPLEIFSGVTVRVARTGDLLALKLLAVDDERPLDQADLRALLAVADDDERRRAQQLIDLIMARGTNRGRDLPGDWAAFVSR